MVYVSIKLDERKQPIYDSNLRKIIFDLANADNFDDQDFYPEYRTQKYPRLRFPKEKED